MNRHTPPAAQPAILVEALEPRIAPAALLETKFTSVVVGGKILLDASGGANDFQGLSTAFGAFSGSYLLYLNAGKAVVYTTDLNGDGILDPGEITGIALAPDSLGRAPDLTLFSDVHGDIVTNLLPGHFNDNLTDLDNNPNNGRDGRILLDNPIAHITLRTVNAADLDSTVPGNTVANRLALTHYSIYGNVISGGDFGGLTIDTSGDPDLQAKFTAGGTSNGNIYLYGGSEITINGIMTGSAASNQYYHFTQNAPQVLSSTNTGSVELVNNNVEGIIRPFAPPAGEHGGDISSIAAARASTLFSIGVIAAGDGGTGARGGNITDVIMHGDRGSYSILAGNGGAGPTGGVGGSVLNFSDLSSVTGQAFIHTGNGGRGTLGDGGVGGTATFGTSLIAADLQVVLGNGGDGFTAGGNGSGLTGTAFSTPDVTLPLGGRFIGTWHDIGDVGNTHPYDLGTTTGVATYNPEAIDFDGDGFGDGVFTTTNPDQVVIVFGDGAGSISDNFGVFSSDAPQKTIVLKVPGGGTPTVTVGDFNGDGRPDIAVASGDLNNFGGINVYLNQIGNTVLDPVNPQNYTHNPLGDHPFSVAQHTAIPLLTPVNTNPYDYLGYFGQGGAILAIAAGDYNGDGITDIAYAERVTAFQGAVGQVVGILFGEQATTLNTDPVLVGAHTATTFVNGSLDNGLINNHTSRPQGTGYFYANPGTFGGSTNLQISIFFRNTNAVYLRATSLSNNNVPTVTTPGAAALPAAQEYVISGIQGTIEVDPYTANTPNPITHVPAAVVGLDETHSFILDNVDTNRNFSGATPQVTLQRPVIQDFTIVDSDQDGGADLVFLYNSPQSFLYGYHGLGNGNFIQSSHGIVDSFGNDNDNGGIFLGNFPFIPPSAIAIAPYDPTHTGRFDGFAIVNLITNPIVTEVREFELIPGFSTNDVFGYDSGQITYGFFDLNRTIDRQVNTIDAFYPLVSSNLRYTNPTTLTPYPVGGFGVLAPNVSDFFAGVGLYFAGDATLDGRIRYLTENGISLYSGNGGNSSNGHGGNAGDLGDGTLNIGTDSGVGATVTTTSSIQLRYTTTVEYQGNSFLRGGNGGDGFTDGGVGGTIQGVTTRYNDPTITSGPTQTSFRAGDGGDAISGLGGNGGSLRALSIRNGPFFRSGSGGSGFDGGTGGEILGNQIDFDTSNSFVRLVTGHGGQGSLIGGVGGTINKWESQLDRFNFNGYLDYSTGYGGSAAGGTGGAGGGILDSPLDPNLNRLSGDLSLVTGPGGNGLAGGAGGNISNFSNQSTEQAAIPTSLTVLAGAGGIGVSAVGGAGGNITAVQSNTTGLGQNVNNPMAPLARIIAGVGGDSYGATGGVGGSLTDVNSTSTSTPLVAAAGAGGLGLTVGGTGGSVMGSTNNTSTLNSAAQLVGKLLVVAGKGGDAYSAQRQDILIPGDIDVGDLAHALLAFGGTSGMGGDGGNVVNVRQPASTQTSVDIIAGNGGNTVNANNAQTPVTGVGRGGSVSNVAVAGTVGSVSRNTNLGQIANPPIKSYAATVDSLGNSTTSLNEFIDFLTGSLINPNGTFFNLTDAIGNVGMVAGASGTVSGGQPARDGINGSVSNVLASSFLSIVAGSVDRVAPVSQLTGIVLTNPDGVLGADKSLNAPFGPNGRLDYYNEFGVDVDNLQPGFRLIDGAIFASQIIPVAGQPVVGPRVNPGQG